MNINIEKLTHIFILNKRNVRFYHERKLNELRSFISKKPTGDIKTNILRDMINSPKSPIVINRYLEKNFKHNFISQFKEQLTKRTKIQGRCIYRVPINIAVMMGCKMSESFTNNIIGDILTFYENTDLIFRESEHYFSKLIQYVLSTNKEYSIKIIDNILIQNDISVYTKHEINNRKQLYPDLDPNNLTKQQFLLYLASKSTDCVEILANLYIELLKEQK